MRGRAPAHERALGVRRGQDGARRLAEAHGRAKAHVGQLLVNVPAEGERSFRLVCWDRARRVGPAREYARQQRRLALLQLKERAVVLGERLFAALH